MADQDSLIGKSPDSATNMAKLVYVLYLVGLIIGVTPIVGVIIAYIYRGDAPDWVKSHFTFQIRTFWVGLLMVVIAVVTMIVVVGWVILLFYLVWLIVRCVIGLKAISAGQPCPKPETWLW